MTSTQLTKCDSDRIYCEPGYEKFHPDDGPSRIGCRAINSTPIEFEEEIIPWVLHMLNVFKIGAECEDYDNCNIGLKLQNAFITKVNGWMGIDKNYNSPHVAFCGLPDMMDLIETDGLRFRNTMSQTVSAVRKV